MSAICGTFRRENNANEALRTLRRMLAAMERRGPNGITEHVDRTCSLALGFGYFRTTPDEPCPGVLTNEDASLTMVCDGHVFNDREVRAWLVGRGHRLTSAHSSELLLHLYEEENIDGWRRADGQFALAIWDTRERRLTLGRDPLGVRSLYYWQGPSGFAFASEPRGVLEDSVVPRAPDEQAISDFLTFTSVPGPRTLFAGVSKLAPGSAAVIDRSGGVNLRRYWDLLDDPVPESGDEQFYIHRVRALHRSAVERRIVEAPMGSLLSGGNDSSANASLMARAHVRPLHTFTVGLAELEGDDKYNDLKYARRVAADIGSEHHEDLLSVPQFLAILPRTIDAMEDLVSEPSSVFLLHALEMAKSEGLSVVVTGEANDELCCGHGGMIHIRNGYYRRWLPFLHNPVWVRRLVATGARLVAPKYHDITRRAAVGDDYFTSYETAWVDTFKHEILNPDLARRMSASARIVRDCRQRFDASGHASQDYIFYVIYAMMQDFYFSNLMLGKLDALASYAGIEPRCPYTEREYAHFAYNVPAALKTKNGLVKYFFKKSIEGTLSDSVIYRPKQGFRTPVIELFRGALGDWAEPILLESGLTRERILRRDHIEEVLTTHRAGRKDFANRLWTVMVLNLWYERWIRRPPAVSA